ncbi:hypothetical protein SAMN05421812_102438 [Asanoa hainanensis]|uniref:Lipoprotein n=2 Tax=Asanoa hainanensis TaxID=560556 RepID=A0A239IK76_9ACTN|nr:hypothetical protein SAMN05421812_102438 [Asanoa hainanensis]
MKLFLTGVTITALVALSGCGTETKSEETASSPAPAATSAAPTTVPTTAPAIDAITAQACADIKKDVKDNADKIAKAEKIGPPAGHIAVSAQWIAGSAAVIAHSIGANATVSAAADKVQQEMMTLGEETNKSARAKPSRKALDAAVAEFNTACSAT